MMIIYQIGVVTCLVALNAAWAQVAFDSHNTTNRMLVVKPLPIEKSLHGRQEKQCKRTTRRLMNGKMDEILECPYEYTVFSQKWMPTSMYIRPERCDKCTSDAQEKVWNVQLMIEGLRPYHPPQLNRPKLMPQSIQHHIDAEFWFNFAYKKGEKRDRLQQEWTNYGILTGLSASSYMREMNQLQNLHPTPHLFHTKDINGAVPLVELEKIYKNSCMVCQLIGGMQYFESVRHCYAINPKSYITTKMVDFHGGSCGPCPPTCTYRNIHVPHLLGI